MPEVSICLPVYNGANYLAQAIDSVLAQTYSDFELLIANDRSTDETEQIIASYADKDNRIKHWINERNLKLFGNYNECIRRATGKYIKPFAHDDLLRPDAIERMVAVLEKEHDVSLVTSARAWIDAEGQVLEAKSQRAAKVMQPFAQDTRISAAEAITKTLKEAVNWLGEPVSQMFRREHAGTGYDPAFKQIGDLEYSYRLLQHGDYYFIADQLCKFRHHAESWSQARSADMTASMDWFLLGARYKNYLEKAGLTSEDYCLNVIDMVIRHFEYELSEAKRLQEPASVLQDMCGGSDPLSFFSSERGKPRNLSSELKGLAVLSFLQGALCQSGLRKGKAAARAYAQSELSWNKEKSELSETINSLKQEATEKDKEIAELRQALSEIGNSMSWKVTAPLRKLKSRQN